MKKTSSRLWIIGAVVGSVVVLGLILWCVLYIHYSNKKRRQQTKPKTLSDEDSVDQEEMKVVKKGRRAKVRRKGLSMPVFAVELIVRINCCQSKLGRAMHMFNMQRQLQTGPARVTIYKANTTLLFA